MANPILWLAWLSFTLGGAALANTEVYFSPSVDCENRTVRAIRDSQKEILAAIYSINNRKIISALISAKNRGVKVQVLTDSGQAAQKTSGVWDLLAEGVDVRLNSKHKIEHNKFALYDGKLLSTGSFNWTGPAARSNSENCLFIGDKQPVERFAKRFAELWKINSADASQAKIRKLRGRALASHAKKSSHR